MEKKIYLEYIIYVYLIIKVIINFNVKLNEYGIKLYFLKYVWEFIFDVSIVYLIWNI